MARVPCVAAIRARSKTSSFCRLGRRIPIVFTFPKEKRHQASPGKPWPGQLSSSKTALFVIDSALFWWILAPRPPAGSPNLPETTTSTAMDRLDAAGPHFAAMAERLLPQSTPSVGHGGKVAVLLRIWHVFLREPPFALTVKHSIFAVWDVESSIALRFPPEKMSFPL